MKKVKLDMIMVQKLDDEFVALMKIASSDSLDGLIRKLKRMGVSAGVVGEVGWGQFKVGDMTQDHLNDIRLKLTTIR